MHPCELKYWKLLVDCCLCISWLKLHAHICSYLFTLTWFYLCTPLNLTIGNSYLISVFEFPDAMHPCKLHYWKLLIDCCLCISWFSPGRPFAVIHLNLHVRICNYPFTFTCPYFQLSIYFYMELSMHPCELNYWKLLIDCCLCISWFSPGRTLQGSIYIYIPIFAIIHFHLHDAIYAPLWT